MARIGSGLQPQVLPLCLEKNRFGLIMICFPLRNQLKTSLRYTRIFHERRYPVVILEQYSLTKQHQNPRDTLPIITQKKK